MPTINQTITSTWVKVASDSDDTLLVTWDAPVLIEVATTSTDVVPTVKGHSLSREDAISRIVLGDGYVWVRLAAGTKPDSTMLVVTK